MSKRNPRLYILGMLNAISRIKTYTAGVDFRDFENNELVVDAVLRNLEVIGEAADTFQRA